MSTRRSTRNKNVSKAAEDISEITDSKIESEEPPAKKTKSKNLKDITEEDNVVTKKTKSSKKAEEPMDEAKSEWLNAKSVHEFSAKDINGKDVSLENYKGHVCIVVNVASKCGHTKSNYEQFVEIFDKYSDEKQLKILAFPCNQFGKQEPGDSQKICEFANKRNVKFDMFEKIDVNGKNAHPLWKFMKDKIAGPKGNNIDWNFTKFIIDKDGNVVERLKPSVKPLKMVEILEKYW